MLAARPLHGNTALKSILWETLLLDQLHDCLLWSWNSFLYPFFTSKVMEKNSLILEKFHFWSPIFIKASMATQWPYHQRRPYLTPPVEVYDQNKKYKESIRSRKNKNSVISLICLKLGTHFLDRLSKYRPRPSMGLRSVFLPQKI